MGCGGITNQVNRPGKKETVYGVFQVKLLEAQIQHQTSKFLAMDPYVIVKFSNQKFQGEVVKKGGTNPKFHDSHRFIVNSCYKYFGRCLELELLDSNIGSDDVIGYGIIDLDPYLNALQVRAPEHDPKQSISPPKDQAVTLRCFLNCDRKPAGIVTLQASFKEEKTDIINFRFQTAEFQRSTRTFGDMECYVRVTAGEEVLETKKSKDTKTDKPVWKDEFLSFICPKSIDAILIEVMDQNKLIGHVELHKNDILLDDHENSFVKDLKYETSTAGKLWFNTNRNANIVFKGLNGDYKKKQPQKQKPVEEKKPEQKKETENK